MNIVSKTLRYGPW